MKGFIAKEMLVATFCDRRANETPDRISSTPKLAERRYIRSYGL